MEMNLNIISSKMLHWVRDYRRACTYGHIDLADKLKDKIDDEIRRLGLERVVVYEMGYGGKVPPDCAQNMAESIMKVIEDRYPNTKCDIRVLARACARIRENARYDVKSFVLLPSDVTNLDDPTKTMVDLHEVLSKAGFAARYAYQCIIISF